MVGPILVHNLVLVETIQDLNQITSLATDKQDYTHWLYRFLEGKKTSRF